MTSGPHPGIEPGTHAWKASARSHHCAIPAPCINRLSLHVSSIQQISLSIFSTEAAPVATEKVAKFVAPTAQPTVNPFKGWEDAPTSVPDTSKVVLNRNYTYPKVEYHGTAPLIATNEIANEAINPEVSVPVENSPSYNLYNKTIGSESVLPVAQSSTTSSSEIGVYDSSTPQEILPVQAGTLEPTSKPLIVMNANELPVVPLEEMEVLEIKENPDWVVEIPSNVQPVENNGVEQIRISFIDKNKPVQGVNEVSLQPLVEGNQEDIKISFLGNQTSNQTVTVDGNSISLESSLPQPEHQSIKISFEKEKENVAPTGVPPVHQPESHVTASLPSTTHVLATPAPPMPSGPGVVNPFEGGIVDKIISNATAAPLTPNQNITVDFLHNAETGIPVEPQPHVTMQQHRK